MSEKPKKVEEVTGFRFFRLIDAPHSVRLRAVISSYVYRGPTNQNPTPPDAGQKSGFYAFNDVGVFMHAYSGSGSSVAGIVEALGETKMHDYGWKSQGIVIRHLFLPQHYYYKPSKIIASLEKEYQCDVTITPHWHLLPRIQPLKLWKQRKLLKILQLPSDEFNRWNCWLAEEKLILHHLFELSDDKLKKILDRLTRLNITASPLFDEAEKRGINFQGEFE